MSRERRAIERRKLEQRVRELEREINDTAAKDQEIAKLKERVADLETAVDLLTSINETKLDPV